MKRYPPFSSARVRGRPLFHWARQGKEKLKEIEQDIPVVEVTIERLEILSRHQFTAPLLKAHLEALIGSVAGDFRQANILRSWQQHVFAQHCLDAPVSVTNDKEEGQDNNSEGGPCCTVLRMKATVTSGTYIRSLAHEMGERLGVGAIALDIFRTRVGDYSIDDAFAMPSTEEATTTSNEHRQYFRPTEPREEEG